MPSLAERLNTDGEGPQLREPANWDYPDTEYAPFELEDATGISQKLGGFLTDPIYAGEDANPDITIEHVENQELSVWIARFNAGKTPVYILSCWDFDHRMHFEISRKTAVSVIEQALDSPYWRIDIQDDGLRETLLESV